ncbi:SDR family oxidoreductase [Dokdonella sp.]|uniref:SDR family oxidoreductase n=1 Tax=Dokdonella sp. TaxID=2291710 RepID=UPI003C32CB86
MSIEDFNGRVAVITGAGSGFGREFALLGAELGMSLVLADVQAEALQSVVGELESRGTRVLARVLDVSDAAQMDALADDAEKQFGDVHLLFNNAGVGTAGLIWENSVADWQWTLGVNLWGVVHGMRAFVPRMLAAAAASPGYQGHVVNTASMAGLLNPPASGVYNVSKSAVVSLSESLHHDLALVTEQVHCSVLCPYYVPTGINESQRNRPVGLANAAPPTRSQRVAQAAMDKAVKSGRISAADVARMTFDAVREGRFYIASHPGALDGVRQRAEDIVALRNPTDPLAARPGLRESMIDALRE